MRIVAIAVFPQADEGDLHDVAGLFLVAQDAGRDLDQWSRLAPDHLVECLFVLAVLAGAQDLQDRSVVGFAQSLASASSLGGGGVDQFRHAYRLRRFPTGRLEQ